LQFRGDVFHPGAAKMALAQMLQMMFFGGLAVSFIGKGMLPQSAQDFMSENQLLVFGTLFGCNIMSGQLINSGAFEVSLNGKPVWSKIESGRFPQMAELVQALKANGLQ
jgi:selT/selW/selH-like putative selenoprotein